MRMRSRCFVYRKFKRYFANDHCCWRASFPLRWNSCLTLGFTCCRKPERGTSGGWRQSGASPGWAPELARACALGPPPAVLSPRPPQADGMTPQEPTAWPDTPSARRGRDGVDTAPGPSASRHPPRPARSAPRGPRAPGTSARGHTQAQHGGTAPGLERWALLRARGTETPHGRRAAAALLPRGARVLGTRRLASGSRRPDRV